MSIQTNEVSKKKKFKLGTFIKETRSELKRVSWPTRKELIKNTGVVLTVIILTTILVWGLDSALSAALNLILQ